MMPERRNQAYLRIRNQVPEWLPEAGKSRADFSTEQLPVFLCEFQMALILHENWCGERGQSNFGWTKLLIFFVIA
jgi:hypothetical protein